MKNKAPVKKSVKLIKKFDWQNPKELQMRIEQFKQEIDLALQAYFGGLDKMPRLAPSIAELYDYIGINKNSLLMIKHKPIYGELQDIMDSAKQWTEKQWNRMLLNRETAIGAMFYLKCAYKYRETSLTEELDKIQVVLNMKNNSKNKLIKGANDVKEKTNN